MNRGRRGEKERAGNRKRAKLQHRFISPSSDATNQTIDNERSARPVESQNQMETRKPASDRAQLNPNSSRPRDRSLNIEALFRCMDCSPCLPISISFPPAERLNLIQTHWCVDNEGVTRSWERPSNSPHRGSGFFLGGV